MANHNSKVVTQMKFTKKEKGVVKSFRLPPKLINRLERVSASCDVTPSEFARAAIEAGVNKTLKKGAA